jgi:RNA polymerase sigma-70 factor (ECF subfamily)
MHVGSDQRLNVTNYGSAARELENVLSRRLPSYYKIAYRLLGNAADAEDAVQDALLAAHKHLGQFRGHSQMSTWLTTIVVNCARMQLRRRPRQIHVAIDDRIGEEQGYSVLERLADGGPNPEDECRNSELKACVRVFAAQLSPTLRRTFQLRDMDGLSISETAHILGVPSGTVKAQLARARAKLKDAMRRARTATSNTPPSRHRQAFRESKGRLESESRSRLKGNPAAVVLGPQHFGCCADEAC